MKKIYSVIFNWIANEHSIFDSESLEEAKAFYENELNKLKNVEPVDITGWRDVYDRAWSTVYFLELVEITIDDDIEENYVTNIETLAYSDYYYV